MKKFILPALLGLAFAACSGDDTTDPASTLEETSGERYMAINIVTNSSSTRADTDDYNNGDEDEYSIVDATKSIFYFFDASGNPFTVNGKNNYVTGTQVSTMETENFGTEGAITATKLLVVLESQSGSSTPAQVVAVINSAYTEETAGTVSLADLKKKMIDKYSITSSGKNCFMMSNAVYKSGSNNICTTQVTAANFGSDAKTAEANSVKIYVERVVGKVSLTNTSTTLTLDTDDITIKGHENDGILDGVTAELIGWKIINRTWETDLLKNIEFDTDPIWPWNDEVNLRSYWANPTASAVQTTTTSDDKVVWSDFENTPSVNYPFENISEEYPSKIMFAIQLKDKNNKPFTVTRWLSTYYTLDDLKTNIAAYLANSLYKDKDSSLTSIEDSDIEFQAYGATQVEPYVETDTVKMTWKSSDGTVLKADEVTALLKAVPKAYIWQKGRCIFYSPIRHTLAETVTDGTEVYGIIRNHWYQVSIKKVVGFGSPVFDEKTPIDPTNPGTEDDSWYLDASIHVLAWRLLPYEVELK